MKTKGSFNVDMGMPPDRPTPAVSEEAKEVVDPVVVDEKKEDAIKRDKRIEEAQKDLRITLDEDDVWQVLFGNTLEKRMICIVPNKYYATFRTLSLADSNAIERVLGPLADSKLLQRGFESLNHQYILASGILEVGNPMLLGVLV